MKKFLLILTLFIFPTIAFGQEIDYKTEWNKIEEVQIDIVDGIYVISADEVLMEIECTPKTVYGMVENGVNIRKVPNTGGRPADTLQLNEYVVEVGRLNGWSLIYNKGNYYFIWNEYLTYDKPENSVYHEVEEIEWEYLGNCRISSYCYCCNTPAYSYKSGVDGWPCSEWETCAMNGIKNGTHIYVEDYGEFVVNDSGPAAMNGACWVDLFVDNSSCHIWTYKDVWIIK